MWLEVKFWSVVRVDGNYADARFCTDMKVILELKYVKINSIGYPFCCSSWIMNPEKRNPKTPEIKTCRGPYPIQPERLAIQIAFQYRSISLV